MVNEVIDLAVKMMKLARKINSKYAENIWYNAGNVYTLVKKYKRYKNWQYKTDAEKVMRWLDYDVHELGNAEMLALYTECMDMLGRV